MIFALQSGWTVETWVLLGLMVVFAVIALMSHGAAYRNGVTDGYGYSQEPNCPGYKAAGEYLRANLAHRWPDLKTPADLPAPDEPEPIHLFFGLTYANYLVVPRSVLQAMPRYWQWQMVVMLRAVEMRFGHLYGDNDYDVRLVESRDDDGDPTRVSPDPLADYRRPDPRLHPGV